MSDEGVPGDELLSAGAYISRHRALADEICAKNLTLLCGGFFMGHRIGADFFASIVPTEGVKKSWDLSGFICENKLFEFLMLWSSCSRMYFVWTVASYVILFLNGGSDLINGFCLTGDAI